MLQSFFYIPSIYINIIIYSQCMCMSVYVHREKEKRGGVDRSILCTKASHPQSDPSSVSGCIPPPAPSPFHWFRSLSACSSFLFPLAGLLSAFSSWNQQSYGDLGLLTQFSFWRNVAMEGVRSLGLLLIFLLQSTPTWSSPSPYHLHHPLQYRAMLYRTRCTSLVCFGFGFSWKVVVCWVSHDM